MGSSLARWVEAVWSSKTFGTLLLDASFKATVVLAAAALAGLLVRRGSASGRHLVWSLAVFAALCLPVFAWLLPSWRVEVVTAVRSQTATESGAGEAAPNEASQVDSARESRAHLTPREAKVWLADQVSGVTATSGGAGLDGLTERFAAHKTGPRREHSGSSKSRVVVTPVTSGPMVSAAEAKLPQLAWTEALLGVWALGVFALLARMVAGRLQVRRLAATAAAVTDDRARLCGELTQGVGLRRKVWLVESDEPVLPMTWGVMRPTVLVPVGSRAWSEERLQLVLLHELAHVRRLDALTQLFAQLACALYWFHPLVWLASRRMRALREYACDDQVLRAGRRPSEYAGELL
ncbi:MAG: M56 family metallopeptidase [Myxococcaceae bacterium]